MPAMKINGKVVGAFDGPRSVNLHGCTRCKSTRGKLGCDEAVTDKNMLAKIDSVFAQKVVSALAAKLDPNEMGRVLNVLRDAGLITDEEVRSVNEAILPSASEEMATDARFRARYPGAVRILSGGIADEQRARQRIAAHDATRAAASAPRPNAAAVKRSQDASDAIGSFNQRYPDAARIGHL